MDAESKLKIHWIEIIFSIFITIVTLLVVGKYFSMNLTDKELYYHIENLFNWFSENLFSKTLIDKVEKEFKDSFCYTMKGRKKENFNICANKQNICDWVCKKASKKDFKEFEKIFQIIEKVLKK